MKENQRVLVRENNEYLDSANLAGMQGVVINGIAPEGQQAERYMVRINYVENDQQKHTTESLIVNFRLMDLELIDEPN